MGSGALSRSDEPTNWDKNDGRPRIGCEHDPLLEALIAAHGSIGRPDIVKLAKKKVAHADED